MRIIFMTLIKFVWEGRVYRADGKLYLGGFKVLTINLLTYYIVYITH